MQRGMALAWVCVAAAGFGCASSRQAVPDDGRVATSLLGTPLHPEPIAPERLSGLEAELAAARAALAERPGDEERIIWVGRREAYLGRFEDAIRTFTEGLRLHPGSYRLLRHRGHRFITLRRFDEALRDLRRAAELARGHADRIEPDGMPNELNQPRSTDHSNIHYHLGLVHYLRGEYAEAERAFGAREGLAAYNDDMLVSTTHWRYLALGRLGRDAEAAGLLRGIRTDMDVIENRSYHRLCLMYKGELAPEDLAALDGGLPDPGTAYGVAAYLSLQGREAEADRLRERILTETSWAAFGHIAAEADAARERAAR
jgi:tetratricopeptide (TPR) repeat protein